MRVKYQSIQISRTMLFREGRSHISYEVYFLLVITLQMTQQPACSGSPDKRLCLKAILRCRLPQTDLAHLKRPTRDGDMKNAIVYVFCLDKTVLCILRL